MSVDLLYTSHVVSVALAGRLVVQFPLISTKQQSVNTRLQFVLIRQAYTNWRRQPWGTGARAPLPLVGGVAQWLERRSWPANFPCPALDLQLMGDH